MLKLLEEVELLLPLPLLVERKLEAALCALLRAPEEIEAPLALTCRRCKMTSSTILEINSNKWVKKEIKTAILTVKSNHSSSSQLPPAPSPPPPKKLKLFSAKLVSPPKLNPKAWSPAPPSSGEARWKALRSDWGRGSVAPS